MGGDDGDYEALADQQLGESAAHDVGVVVEDHDGRNPS